MRDPIGDVPGDYAVHRVASTWLVLERANSASLIEQRLADPRVRAGLFARAPRRGRGRTPSVALDPHTSMVLRHYRHGGLLAPLFGSLFRGPGRPLRELLVCARAEAAGAPVPRVLCLVLWPVFGPFWSALIGTREERPASELLSALQKAGPDEAIRLARATGRAIRSLHDAGVEHRDLQLHNVLVIDEDASWRVVVVDLDRAVFHAQGLLPTSRRADNLGRLARSAVKNGLWRGRIDSREMAAFVGAYTAGDRELRVALRGWVARERLKVGLHRLRYRFMRLPPAAAVAEPPRPA